jgi:4-carboxymuconolactone decarboxylase
VAKSSEQNSGETTARVDRRDFLTGAATLAGTSLVGLAVPAAAQTVAPSHDRMPPLSPEQMSDAQKKVVADMMAGPRKSVGAPFTVLLRSPGLADTVQKFGEYLIYKSKIPAELSEFVILLVARQWTQQTEWRSHSVTGPKAGVKPEILAAIGDGRRPQGMSADEEMLYDFYTELYNNHSVSDVTYARVLNRFGDETLIDFIGLIGYYTLLAMGLNVSRQPVQPGKIPLLAPYPY